MLLTDLQSLQIVLGGAVATAQPVLYSAWADHTATAFTPSSTSGATNGATAVVWVAAPAASAVRQVKSLSCYNADSVAVTATVRVNDGGTLRVLRVVTLLPGETLEYGDTTGWRVAAAAVSATPADFISGLRMQWVSGTAITVESGSAYVQSLARRVDVTAPIAKAGLSLSASTWYHVYLFLSGGVPDIELSTTAPAAAYNGSARSKTGDPSRRYLGSVLTDGASAVINFQHLPSSSQVLWITAIGNAPFLVLSGGNATTTTNVSMSGVVPVTAIAANVQAWNTDTTATGRMGNSNLTSTLTTSVWLARAFPTGTSIQVDQPFTLVLDSSQRFNYVMTGTLAAGGLSVRVAGYYYER